MDFKKFPKILGIEIIIIIAANFILNKFIFYNTFMSIGSWGIYAPLPFFEKLYSNGNFLSSNFNLMYLLIDIIVLTGIAILLSFVKSRKPEMLN